MAVPSAPLDLSAEATDGNTVELRWSAPEDDGGNSITGYQIERNLNDTSYVILVADTGDDSTEYTDTTLSPRDNAVYRVFAINIEGTGDVSDAASTTTATSESQTITELLYDNWSLSGELSKTVIGDMDEVVQFFDRSQVPGNKIAKAVTVQKINELGNENIIEHPKFFEQSDTFEVTCLLQVTDSGNSTFSVWVDLMQQMCGEVVRILKTKYSPSETTGEFFRTHTSWNKDDTFFPDDPMLVRTLRFTLTRLVSSSDETFIGYGGILAFQVLGSVGDSLPASDYIYTEVQRVQTVQGWRNLPYVTTDSPQTTAIPIYFRGAFSGQFSCQMFLKKSDIDITTLNSLQEIFLPQSNGELGTAVFLHTTSNTEGIVNILKESIPVNITSVDKIAENEQLVSFSLRGNFTEPSTFTVEQNVTMTFPDGTPMAYTDGTTTMEYE